MTQRLKKLRGKRAKERARITAKCKVTGIAWFTIEYVKPKSPGLPITVCFR